MAAGRALGAGGAWLRGLLSWARPERWLASSSVFPLSCIHTSACLQKVGKWEKKNRIVYPPQLPGEPRRPAEIYHCRRDIKYSKDKMWYLAKLVLLEAQEMAVKNHNVEFKSNLHIAESLTGRGQYTKRIRYHGKGMFGIMKLVRCHYFVKLVEGPPPPPEPRKTGFDQAKEYVQQLRNRTLVHTL
ncbi:large ribosomal subunit protein uL22m isoform 2-T2 [Mergus octosetaceus]